MGKARENQKSQPRSQKEGKHHRRKAAEIILDIDGLPLCDICYKAQPTKTLT